MDTSPEAVAARARKAKQQRDRRQEHPELVRATENTQRARPGPVRERRKVASHKRYLLRAKKIKAENTERRAQINAELEKVRTEERRLLQLREGRKVDDPTYQANAKAKTQEWRTKQDPVRMLAYLALKRQDGAKWNDPEIDRLADALRPAPTHCPVLGVELLYNGAGGVNNPAGATVDKFDPKGRYEAGNVSIMSRRANAMKNDGTLDEHQKLVTWMLSKGGKTHGTGNCRIEDAVACERGTQAV